MNEKNFLYKLYNNIGKIFLYNLLMLLILIILGEVFYYILLDLEKNEQTTFNIINIIYSTVFNINILLSLISGGVLLFKKIKS